MFAKADRDSDGVISRRALAAHACACFLNERGADALLLQRRVCACRRLQRAVSGGDAGASAAARTAARSLCTLTSACRRTPPPLSRPAGGLLAASRRSAQFRSSALASATTASWCAASRCCPGACKPEHSCDARQILSGDVIEASVGVALGLSTMAAAGCGNMVSDVLGIGISNQIEASPPPASPSVAFADARVAAPNSARATPWASARGSLRRRCSCEPPRVRCSARLHTCAPYTDDVPVQWW